MNSKTYLNVSQDCFNVLLAQCKANGVTVDGDTLNTHGVTVAYAYANDILTLTIKAKHFPASLVSNSDIFTKIEQVAGLKA